MYLTIQDLLDLIDEPACSACKKILEDNYELFHVVQGASHNHQAWRGGYIDHVTEVMNLAVELFPVLYILRPPSISFSLSDALLVLWLHDVEKPWKYKIGQDGELCFKEELQTKEAQHQFRIEKLQEYGITLTPDQLNGLTYVEGEYKDWSPKHRVMSPLAAFCHICDVTSARIWFDYPAEQNDPWIGAKRQRIGKE